LLLAVLAAGFWFGGFRGPDPKPAPKPGPEVRPVAAGPTAGSAPALPNRGALRTLRVVATGYTAGYESTGKNPGDPGYGVTASGLPAAPGACATDPDVIPLGSVLYVPGYGYAVALDTGGDVKGNRIDLFFQDKQQALGWGRRAVEVALIH